MFDFATPEIREKYLKLLYATTGDEDCVDAKLLGEREPGDDSPTDKFVEAWTSGKVSSATAQKMCADCPVLELCRDYAVSAKEPWGIWGGTTPIDRGYKPGRGSSVPLAFRVKA